MKWSKDGKEKYKTGWEICKVVGLLITPLVFLIIILIAVALLDLKVPVNLIKDCRGEGPSLKEREA